MRKLLGLIALGLSLIAAPLAAQTTASTGQGVQLNQRVQRGGVVNFETQIAAAEFPSAPVFSTLGTRVNEFFDLSLFGAGLRERLNTGLIRSSAMATATQATGNSIVTNLDFSLGTDQSSLLSITALRVESSSSATTSPLDTTGTTTIVNLQLTGSLFGPTNTLTLTAAQQTALAAGTPNIVVFDSGSVRITLNRQVETTTANADGTTTLAIATDAIAVQFFRLPVGTGIKDGELLIASSSASATALVPISPQ